MTKFKIGDYVEIIGDYNKGMKGIITYILNDYYELRVCFSTKEKYYGGAFKLNEVKPTTKELFEQQEIIETL